MKLSIIIPVLNEKKTINKAVESLYCLKSPEDFEIIVVDGDPSGTTLDVITDDRVVKTTSEPGRGIQMNRGSFLAKGEYLLFLHSDTFLPEDGISSIIDTLEDKNIKAGAFNLGIDGSNFLLKIIGKTASFRSRITKIPFGDQGIFLRKSFFIQIGEYQEIPIMEDIDLLRRIKKSKGEIKILKTSVLTSSRRWNKEGLIYCTFRNWILLTLYFLGVSPFKLKEMYK